MNTTQTDRPLAAGDRVILIKTGAAGVVDSVKGRWVKVNHTGTILNYARADLTRVEESPQDSDKPRYAGPMLLLRERSKRGAYQRAKNGQPSCGDDLAQILGQLKPEFVIRACLIALDVPTNPYLHLNIGQQSMNLRNKLRGALKREEFGMGVVKEAAEDMLEAQEFVMKQGVTK